MILSIQPQGDMEQKPNHKLILTITPNTNQMRPPLGQASWIQREDQAKFTEIENQAPNSLEKKQSIFTSTYRTKQIYMAQDIL